MWDIYEHRRVGKQLSSCPLEVQKRYEKWKDIVQLSGPKGLLLIRGFRDEQLAGKLKGFRSSRLSKQYRVIYKIEKDHLIVDVLEVNPHDYWSKA